MRDSRLMENILYSPYLLFSGGKVLDVGYALVDLIGFRKQDFIDKDVAEVVKGMLKCAIPADELYKPKTDSGPHYIFTRDGEARQVYISVLALNQSETAITFREVPGSRLDDIFYFAYDLCSQNNYAVAVYDVSSKTIIKSSQQFSDISSALFSKDDQGDTGNIAAFLELFDDSRVLGEYGGFLDKADSGFARNVFSTRLEKAYDILLIPLQERNEHLYNAFFMFENDGTENGCTGAGIFSAEKKPGNLNDNDTVCFIMHELKTPINVVISAVQAMESICADELSPHICSYISRIKNNVNKQLRLLNTLLDISKAESGYMQVHSKNMDIVRLTRAIVESVRMYAMEKGISIKFNTLLRHKIVAIDAVKYERIMLNLLSNAIKYTESGKLIHVNMSKIRDQICVEVRDEGIGISPEEKEFLFNRFWQSNNSMIRFNQGTGIGLALVKNLVAVLGGKITVDSELGKGSSFKVFLNDRQIDEGAAQLEHSEDFDDQRLEQEVSIEFADIYIEEKKQDEQEAHI